MLGGSGLRMGRASGRQPKREALGASHEPASIWSRGQSSAEGGRWRSDLKVRPAEAGDRAEGASAEGAPSRFCKGQWELREDHQGVWGGGEAGTQEQLARAARWERVRGSW